jgi:hypothetical protein
MYSISTLSLLKEPLRDRDVTVLLPVLYKDTV